jgi:hypothetical protein
MAKQWKCARCSTKNDEGTLTCTNCRMIRGAVVVPGTFNASPDAPPVAPAAPIASEASVASEAPVAPSPPSDPLYWVQEHAANQPAAAPLGRRVPIGWLIFVIFLGIGAVASFISNAGRSETGEIVNDGDMMAIDLRVGDCFDLKDPSADEITDVTARPCTDPHEYELFWTGNMPAGAYPSEVAFDAFFSANCIDAFTTYVGRTYADSKLDIYWLYPLESGWDEGDRSIQCAAYHPNDNQLTSSVRATAQ